MENIVWFILNNIKGLGNKTLFKIYKECPDLTLENINSYQDNLTKIIKKSSILDAIFNNEQIELNKINTKKMIENHLNNNIYPIDISSDYYPVILRNIDDPPIVLYAKGNKELLKDNSRVAFIGTREPTKKGYLAAKKLARLFANNGYTIVSGLAVGIDTAGHEGALEATNGKTIAVLASGLDSIYPAENKHLAQQILTNNGLLLSEYPLGARAFKSAFVQRDRIQSGLSLAVCPVQTPIEGGTQHTIKFSINQNRVLFCPSPQESESIKATQGIYQLIDFNKALVINGPQDYEIIINAIKQKAKEFDVEVPEQFINYNSIQLPKDIEVELDNLLNLCKTNNISYDQIMKAIKNKLND